MSASNISSLPSELWAELIDIILSLDDKASLPSAYNLTQTCTAFRHSGPGQRVRYLYALSRHALSPPNRRLPKNLNYESQVLETSRWPHLAPSASTSAAPATLPDKPNEAWGHEPVLKGDKLYFWDGVHKCLKRFSFEPAAQDAAAQASADADASEPQPRPPGETLSLDLEMSIDAEVLEYIVDEEANVVAFLTLPDPNSIEIHASIYSLETGACLPSKAQKPFKVDHDKFIDCSIAGDYLLLKGPRELELLRWNNAAAAAAQSWTEEDAQVEFTELFTRSFAAPSSPEFFTSARLLYASLLSPQVLVLLTAPPTTAHGQDWGATLEFHLISDEGAVCNVVNVNLPLRSTPVHGLSYVACGTKFEEGRNALMVVSVEGYIWLAEMDSFTNLIWPKNSVVRYGEAPVVLDTEWVKSEMQRFSIGSNDAPTSAASVSGWRMAIAWRQKTGDLKSAFVRFVDASPKTTSEPHPTSSCEQLDGQLIYSTWWQDRYLWYWDHPAETMQAQGLAEPDKAELLSVTLQGGRLLAITGPASQLTTRVWRV